LTTTELTCKEFVELVTEYLENALVPEQRVRFEVHLAACDGCHAYLEQMRETLIAAGCLRPEAITPEAQAKLLAMFRSWKDEDKEQG
jgi:predicted anti-sigma-YlaC factor YlaD